MRAALAALALVLAAAPPAAAVEDPFVVCVTEPCGPQPPEVALACVGPPCDLVNAACELLFRRPCVR